MNSTQAQKSSFLPIKTSSTAVTLVAWQQKYNRLYSERSENQKNALKCSLWTSRTGSQLSRSVPLGAGLLPGRAAPWGGRAGWSTASCTGWWTSPRTQSGGRQGLCHRPGNAACLVSLPSESRDAPRESRHPSATPARGMSLFLQNGENQRAFPQKLLLPLK